MEYKMDDIVKDPLIVMGFSLKEEESLLGALKERKHDVQNTFKNNEFLKFDATNQEIIGLKSTTKVGRIAITDLPALNYVIENHDKYKESIFMNLGNVDMIYAKFE